MKKNVNCKLQIENCKLRGKNGALAICILSCFAVCAQSAFSQQYQRPKFVGVRVGIADRYKAGLWTQVEVTLRGGTERLSGELRVIVPDGDGVPGCASKPCSVLPGEDTTVRLITRFGHADTLTVEFRVEGDLVARKVFESGLQVDADHFLSPLDLQGLVVVVGDSTLGIDEVGKLSGLEPEARPVAARVDEVERLPTNWCGYEGVDAVILSTSRPEIYRKLTANNAQMPALDQWVRMGGRLVLCVGSQADEVLAAGSPLARFAPGRLERMVSLRDSGALESYAKSRVAVLPAGSEKAAMRVPRLADVEGAVEVAESDLPLVVRTARGFGQVIFVAGDLDRAPLGKWSDRPRLMARLLDQPTDRVKESSEDAAMMHYGYTDMAGQIRSALDRFTGVRQAPFWFVAGLIVVYILLIGPGDYFFLRKVVKRMEWTWLTFPAIVVAVSLGAYVLAYWLKGDQLRLHQLDLVDVDAASGKLRGTTWLNIFSPRMEAFNLTVRPRQWWKADKGPPAAERPEPGPRDGSAAETRVWMAWFGLPGGALGGMNSRGGGPMLWTEQFRYAPDLSSLWGVPIQVWSTKSLTARWEAPAPVIPAADLTAADQLLSGSITNTLPFALDNCLLAYGRSAYELGRLAPGEAVRLGTMSKRSDLTTYLTGRRAVFTEADKSRQAVTPYEQSSTDPAYILRMMMFYEAAGGRRYTGLWNAYQEFVDLSTLLKADRAILVAQGPASDDETRHGAQLVRLTKPNDADVRPLGSTHDQHITLYRFVFPVKKERSRE
jgi:hypothetical protein